MRKIRLETHIDYKDGTTERQDLTIDVDNTMGTIFNIVSHIYQRFNEIEEIHLFSVKKL